MDCAMGLVEEIADQIGIPLTRRGSLILVSADNALKLLDGCESVGLRILGVEGFQVRESSIVPDMDAIADFSNLDSAIASIREARRLIHIVRPHELVFDFTVAEPK